MDPAPLCKTAILSFIIDETLTKFWNVSSNSRKRTQMIVGERYLVVRKYNVNALKINGWVRMGRYREFVKEIDNIKKGVSNYHLMGQEEVDRIISLNGKLRCYGIAFQPEVPFELDYIEKIKINKHNFDYYVKCSFNQASNLSLYDLSSTQIDKIINKFKQINHLNISYCSISNLDLSSRRINRIAFEFVTFSEEVYLPSNLDYLQVFECSNTHFLNPRIVKEIYYCKNDSLDLIKKCKGLKIVDVNAQLSKFINYLPSTSRELVRYTRIDLENIDLAELKKKLPFLIRINSKTLIETAQTLNLRAINPMINETKETFTYRPREINVNDGNVEQFNKHPELFEKLERIRIHSNKFNFDYLPVGIKEIGFCGFQIEGEKPESLEKNSWKLEKSIVSILYFERDQVRKILNCLTKVVKIEIGQDLKYLAEGYPQFKFTLT